MGLGAGAGLPALSNVGGAGTAATMALAAANSASQMGRLHIGQRGGASVPSDAAPGSQVRSIRLGCSVYALRILSMHPPHHRCPQVSVTTCDLGLSSVQIGQNSLQAAAAPLTNAAPPAAKAAAADGDAASGSSVSMGVVAGSAGLGLPRAAAVASVDAGAEDAAAGEAAAGGEVGSGLAAPALSAARRDLAAGVPRCRAASTTASSEPGARDASCRSSSVGGGSAVSGSSCGTDGSNSPSLYESIVSTTYFSCA